MSAKKRSREWKLSEKAEMVQAIEKGLRVEDVRSMYGVCAESLYRWKKAYAEHGLAGLESHRCGPRMRKLNAKVEAAEKIIDGIVAENPRAGAGKIQGVLYRQGFLRLAKNTVLRLLRRNNLAAPAETMNRSRNKPPKKTKRFERSNANDLWQTDIMTFMLKGQYRVYLIGFMDDYSRFIVGWGLYRFQTSANVQEVFRGAIEKHGMPREVLSDNGRQYHTWRGRSSFTQLLTKLGIRHIRSQAYHPQTQGKIESFWRNLLQESLSVTPLSSFEEAEAKIGEYMEYYNFKRPHQGIGNLVPSDRYFGVAGQVRDLIKANSAQLAEQVPCAVKEYTKPTYLVGSIGGQELRLIARDAQVSLEKPSPEMVESGDKAAVIPAEVCDGRENGRPEGAAGADPYGTIGEEGRGGTVQGSGDLAGAVLPVAGTGEGAGPESAGAEGTGPGSEGSQPGGREEAGSASGKAEQEAVKGPEGVGVPGAGGEDGAEDNTAQRLGESAAA
jgi:transposase InsO family protein